ncbi:hypothetical protein BSIN_1280 [Burkholderia singularis]|uniref:Uncharacterized protein n=1 Tax=Burkholderia singularis TaxID=1503053 RepID=A0A238GYB6_9BURK|nr:hypothetical protein BSIN_1280 [Burkholderia singularis]
MYPFCNKTEKMQSATQGHVPVAIMMTYRDGVRRWRAGRHGRQYR